MQDLLKFTLFFKKFGLLSTILFILYFINPFELGHFPAYILTFLVFINKKDLIRNIDSTFLILTFFCLTFTLFSFFDPKQYIQTLLFYLLFPPTFYLFGKYVSEKTSSLNELYYILIGLGLIYSFSAILSVVVNLIEGGFAQFDRMIPNFWNRRLIKATLMGAFFTFNMTIPTLFMVGKIKSKLFKLFLVVIFIISLLCVFRLGSRTQLAICFASLIITLLYITPKQNFVKNIKLLLTIILIILFVYIFVPIDLNADYLSTLGRRLESSDNAGSAGGRTELWSKSLQNLFSKPLGWDEKEFGYSHNLWLDVAQKSGLIPFIFLMIFSIKTLLNTKQALSKIKKKLHFHVLIIVYILSINLLFMVEPIMHGALSLFLIYCFIQGTIENSAKLSLK